MLDRSSGLSTWCSVRLWANLSLSKTSLISCPKYLVSIGGTELCKKATSFRDGSCRRFYVPEVMSLVCHFQKFPCTEITVHASLLSLWKFVEASNNSIWWIYARNSPVLQLWNPVFLWLSEPYQAYKRSHPLKRLKRQRKMAHNGSTWRFGTEKGCVACIHGTEFPGFMVTYRPIMRKKTWSSESMSPRLHGHSKVSRKLLYPSLSILSFVAVSNVVHENFCH